MSKAPTGVVSFLFTDVEGSTKLWENHPDDMRSALADHDRIMRESIASTDGIVFSTAGDAFAAAFQTPDDAVTAAATAQRGLDSHPWPAATPLRVRMGVHTGLAHQRDNDYFGPTLNRTARLMSAAHGGQTVVSAATQELLSDANLVDMGEHRLKDLSKPERVWQLLVEGLSKDFPPLRTLNSIPTNLPADLGSFIGREDDLARLLADLDKSRLVVLTGVGGVGKTRLSLQAAADASDHFRDGLWLVELAPVQLEDAVPYKFLETLGLEAEPGQSPLQTLGNAIGDGAVLLVVDNCEHVPGPVAAAIGSLLGSCPNLKVIASSRRTLGVTGEQVRAIAPLSTAGVDSAAVQLFLDRAAAAGQSGLAERSHVIATICAKLDGVPLAIELAAARTRSMTPEDLLARLDERFRLLRGSRGGSDERHQTLVSTIEWSYQLLTPDQQLLLQRLSVFAGSFTLSAVEQICADDRLDAFDILDLADELVDHSLLIADTTGSRTRYRMLEMIREYARTQLGDGLGALRDAHARYHADWVDSIFAQLLTTDEPAALEELESGWSDLRTAVTHATGDLDLLARMLGPLAYDGMFRSRLELAEWATTALAVAATEDASHVTRVILLATAAGLCGLAGQGERATAFGNELCEISETTGAPVSAQVAGTAIAGMVLSGQVGISARIQDLAEKSLPADAAPWAVVMSGTFRSIVSTYTGKPDVAKEAIARARTARPANFSPSFSALLGWMSAVNSDAPRIEVAKMMETVVAEATLVKSSFLQAVFNQYLSSVRGELGDLRQPLQDAEENLKTMIVTGNLGLAVATVRRAAVLLIKAEAFGAAATLLAWVDGTEHNIPPTADLAAELDTLVPTMRDALGDPAFDAAEAAGKPLTTVEAMELGVASLHDAVQLLNA